MDANAADMRRVNQLKLTRLVARSFEKLGVPADDAEIAAKVLVAADLRGVDTHGVTALAHWLTARQVLSG
jgi:LDH2 family malate/lactate/ureidoglycolate dehydrogenase